MFWALTISPRDIFLYYIYVVLAIQSVNSIAVILLAVVISLTRPTTGLLLTGYQ